MLYTGFTPEFAREMGKLCGKADVIVPNLTEAAFMLGEEYVGEEYDEAYVHGLLRRLTGLGCRTAILTGHQLTSPTRSAPWPTMPRATPLPATSTKNSPVRFHGTGDVFASACVGALMNDQDLTGALKIAVDYTLESIRATMADPKANWYGGGISRPPSPCWSTAWGGKPSLSHLSWARPRAGPAFFVREEENARREVFPHPGGRGRSQGSSTNFSMAAATPSSSQEAVT